MKSKSKTQLKLKLNSDWKSKSKSKTESQLKDLAASNLELYFHFFWRFVGFVVLRQIN